MVPYPGPDRDDDRCMRPVAAASVRAAFTVAADEMQASAAQRSAPASLPQPVETSSGAAAIAFHARR
jgi:hypothetical protein